MFYLLVQCLGQQKLKIPTNRDQTTRNSKKGSKNERNTGTEQVILTMGIFKTEDDCPKMGTNQYTQITSISAIIYHGGYGTPNSQIRPNKVKIKTVKQN